MVGKTFEEDISCFLLQTETDVKPKFTLCDVYFVSCRPGLGGIEKMAGRY